MGKENQLVWKPLQAELKRRHWPHQRFEDKLSTGIPDVNVHVPTLRLDVWAELKYPDQSSAAYVVRPAQSAWIRKARKGGRTAGILSRLGNLWLWHAERWEDLLTTSSPEVVVGSACARGRNAGDLLNEIARIYS